MSGPVDPPDAPPRTAEPGRTVSVLDRRAGLIDLLLILVTIAAAFVVVAQAFFLLSLERHRVARGWPAGDEVEVPAAGAPAPALEPPPVAG